MFVDNAKRRVVVILVRRVGKRWPRSTWCFLGWNGLCLFTCLTDSPALGRSWRRLECRRVFPLHLGGRIEELSVIIAVAVVVAIRHGVAQLWQWLSQQWRWSLTFTLCLSTVRKVAAVARLCLPIKEGINPAQLRSAPDLQEMSAERAGNQASYSLVWSQIYPRGCSFARGPIAPLLTVNKGCLLPQNFGWSINFRSLHRFTSSIA